MGVQQLINIIIECKQILTCSSNPYQYSSLIQKMNHQLQLYQQNSTFKHLLINQSFNNHSKCNNSNNNQHKYIDHKKQFNNQIQFGNQAQFKNKQFFTNQTKFTNQAKLSNQSKLLNQVKVDTKQHQLNNESIDKQRNKRIFDDSSNQKSVNKNNKQQQYYSHSFSSIIPSPSQKYKNMQISQSQVSSISLDNVKFNINHINDQQDQFQSLSSSHHHNIVNNSFSQQIVQPISINKSNNHLVKQQNKTILKQQNNKQLQIQDYFIIDFNFDTNQYQILPKKQNYYDKCHCLYQNQSQHLYNHQYNSKQIHNHQQNNSKQIHYPNNINQLNNSNLIKQSSNKQKITINPFNQILIQQQINKSLINNNNNNISILKSTNRYSIQPQVNSTNSRILSQYSNNDNIQQKYQIRQVIMNLVTNNSISHIKQIKPTSSMTQLLKLTTNPSSKNKHIQHIIIPSFLEIRNLNNSSSCNKYTHIIKTYQAIHFNNKYYQCQRFFVIIEKYQRFIQIQNIVNQLIKKAFEMRIKIDKLIDNVKYHNIKKYTNQIALIPKLQLVKYGQNNGSNKLINDSTYYPIQYSPLYPLQQVSLYCQAAINFKFTLQINSQTKSFNLVLILIYFVIFEYKIIFITTSSYQTIVSQIINCLVHMIGDLRYIYPIIMAVLTNHHIQFVNAPVPGLVALWGKQSRHKKAVYYMRRKLRDEAIQYMSSSNSSQQCNGNNSLLSICIDMNKHEFIDHQFTHKQLYIIQSLHNYIKTNNINDKEIDNNMTNRNKINTNKSNNNKGNNNLLNKMNNLFNDKLIKQQQIIIDNNNKDIIQNNNYKNKNKWIYILKQRLRKTQMYQEYMKYQSSIHINK